MAAEMARLVSNQRPLAGVKRRCLVRFEGPGYGSTVGRLADYGGVNRAKKTSSEPCLARGRAWMNVAAKPCGRPARP